jgi:hypothetical protein
LIKEFFEKGKFGGDGIFCSLPEIITAIGGDVAWFHDA